MRPAHLAALLGGGLLFLYLRGYRMIFRDGATTALSPRMAAALPLIDAVTRQVAGRDAYMTHGTDGQHSAGSKHYTGDATDWRTRDLSWAVKKQLAEKLNDELNEGGHVYDVIVHSTHIHIEVDPRPYRRPVMLPSGAPAYA